VECVFGSQTTERSVRVELTRGEKLIRNAVMRKATAGGVERRTMLVTAGAEEAVHWFVVEMQCFAM
jgi:hypothetical protein